ncbi:MAG: DEAD/DEAH box helicase [Sarcina sp.]
MYIQTELNLNDFIDEKKAKEFMSRNELITNIEDSNFLLELKESFKDCKAFYFSVAFINFSGLQLILDELQTAKENDVKGCVITSTYLNFTAPVALKRLKEFDNINLKIFVTEEKMKGFHTKVYIFEYDDFYKVYIGSSNLTQSALKSNEEWNVKIISKKDDEFVVRVMENYKRLMDETDVVDDEFLHEYESFIRELKVLGGENKTRKFLSSTKKIKPNLMQAKALENLKRLRAHDASKALVIAATGTGKTYMSAFDVREVNPKKMLFIVHREDILRKAISDYEKIIENKKFGLFTGNIKEKDSDYLFATIQSMSRYYDEFREDEFDYIIIDEAHHSSSDTYQRVLNYFKPKFLLGMTATPERAEGNDIFTIYDNNIALEVRLVEALEENLVVPFHYFGITDIELVDYAGIDINDVEKVAKILQINERVDFVIEKMNFYGFDGDKRKCVGFCVNVAHARYMAQQFNLRGIKSIALTSKNSIEERREKIKNLEDDNADLEVIFTVDLFNEGVDIPPVNTILMLRPTQSSIVFIQQLGRGLRKFVGKEFLTVLDFIGNHNKAFLVAMALNGTQYYDKDSLKVSLKTNFVSIPGDTNIQMDEIAKERILAQIDSENFNALKYLKEEYMEFKKVRGGRPVGFLTEYFLYEGAPEPLKFIGATPNKSYLAFLEKIEKGYEDTKLLKDKLFKDVLKDVSVKLPLKRPYEYIILRELIEKGFSTKIKLKEEIEKYIEFVDDRSFEYTLECLRGDYHSKKESNYNFIEVTGESVKLADEIGSVVKNEKYRLYINDCINYGLLRYEREFGEKNYGNPFLKLYFAYSRDDVMRMANTKKKFSGFGMGGQKASDDKKSWYMFVNFEKEAGIKDSINHVNEFIGDDIFVWESKSTTILESEAGQQLINNKKYGIEMHLFVRKYKDVDGVTQPYIYMGKCDSVAHFGEMPIVAHLKLQNKVPNRIMDEFTK